MTTFEKSIYNFIIKNNISIAEDVFIYGIRLCKRYLLFIVLIIPISIFLNIYQYVAFFIISYFPLKKYIGGFHFKNFYICTFFSILLSVLLPLIAMHVGKISFIYQISCFIFSIIVTISIAPVDHENKSLTLNEKKIYKRKSIIVEIVYLFISCIVLSKEKIYSNIQKKQVCLHLILK